MFYIAEAYDDYTAYIDEVTEAGCMKKKQLKTEHQLIQLSKEQEIVGLYASDDRVESLIAYEATELPTPEELKEYVREHGISEYKTFENVLLTPKSGMLHVEYVVGYELGYDNIADHVCYLGEKGSYTNYLDSAKVFNRADAQKTAALMRQRGKTGKLWKAIRIEVGHED